MEGMVLYWFRDLEQAKKCLDAVNVEPKYVTDAKEWLSKAPYSPARKKLLRAAQSRWSDARHQMSMSRIRQWPPKKYCREYLRIASFFHGDLRDNRAIQLPNKTPKWFGEFDKFVIEEIASLRVERERVTGIKWHMDHMYPLGAKEVSGLHVGINLQLIPATLNRKKCAEIKYAHPGQWLDDLHLACRLKVSDLKAA
jgi:hypothetical protein